MESVYVVTNDDEIIMGIFTDKEKTLAMLDHGRKTFKEKWAYELVMVDSIPSWMLKSKLEEVGINIVESIKD